MATPQTQRSVPEVLQDIVGNLQDIIRSEFRLAQTEITEEASKAARPAAAFGVGLISGIYGIGFMLLAAVYGLSTVMPAWLAALLVGIILAIVAGAFIGSGREKLKRINLIPDKAIKSLEEHVEWSKHQIK
jgi:Putative Actinobacterial Holin-X, holin superfamily III